MESLVGRPVWPMPRNMRSCGTRARKGWIESWRTRPSVSLAGRTTEAETRIDAATAMNWFNELAEQLMAQAKEQGVELVGPNGLLNQMTKNVLETALDAEMTEHLGYDRHDPTGAVAATPVTGCGPRRCSPRSGGRHRVPRVECPRSSRRPSRRSTSRDRSRWSDLSLSAKGPPPGKCRRTSPTSAARRCRRTPCAGSSTR